MHHPTDRITHTTAFVTPVVDHWLEREIAHWVHPMKDRSEDPSHHERTLLPRSYISLSTYTHTHIYIYNIHIYNIYNYVRTYIYTNIHRCMHTCIQHTYIKHACIHTYTHTYTHACMHTYIHIYTHTYARTYARTYIHILIYYNKQMSSKGDRSEIDRLSSGNYD